MPQFFSLCFENRMEGYSISVPKTGTFVLLAFFENSTFSENWIPSNSRNYLVPSQYDGSLSTPDWCTLQHPRVYWSHEQDSLQVKMDEQSKALVSSLVSLSCCNGSLITSVIHMYSVHTLCARVLPTSCGRFGVQSILHWLFDVFV